MKILSLIFFLANAISLFGQEVLNPARQKHDSLIAPPRGLDSMALRLNNNIDSLQLNVNNLLDPNISLDQTISRLRTKRLAKQDSLGTIRELDSLKTDLRFKIDSLSALDLPTDKYKQQLDSLAGINPQEYFNRLQGKANELQASVNSPVDDLEDKLNKPVGEFTGKVNEKLDLMNKEGGSSANLPGNVSVRDVNLPGVELKTDLNNLNIHAPGIDVPGMADINNPIAGEMEQISGIGEKITELKDVPQQQLDRIKAIDEVQAVEGKLGQANSLVDKAQAYQQDAVKIAQGDLGEVEQIPKAIENKVSELAEVQELQKMNGEVSKYQEMLAKGNDPAALRQLAKQQAVSYAMDHFAGQQQALKGAMDQMSKLKSKYSQVASIKDLPKRMPNPMKDKPFVERLVPGFTFQIQKSGKLLVDLSPTMAWMFTGRLTAGAGWNERLSFREWNQLVPQDRIYGPRAFASFGLKKGFSLKAEVEKMNTYLPALTNTEANRAWVWGVFAGIKKDYKFYKTINGNVQLLYNIYDDQGNSPYVDRFNVRMGFEFGLKKR